jgi:predicted metal-dependent phosphoesterase TrpH
VLDLIHSAKGVAVMAHPVMFNNTELLLELIEAGKLDGIEAYHYSATPTQQQKLVDIAKEHDLIVTGGSDFHGLYNETMTHIGSMTTDKENLDKLFKLIHINSQKANKAAVKTEK